MKNPTSHEELNKLLKKQARKRKKDKVKRLKQKCKQIKRTQRKNR